MMHFTDENRIQRTLNRRKPRINAIIQELSINSLSNLGTTDGGSFGRNILEILMLSGSLVRPIRFRLPALNYIYGNTSLIGAHPF
jgi:hypothetical protein